jgi:uncharacterized protein (TIGR02594 family)
MEVRVTGDVNLRKEATTGQILAVLKKGTIVEADSLGWAQIKTKDGKSGWVSDQFLEAVGLKPSVGLPWMDLAKTYIGIHELVGGENKQIIEFFKSTTYKAVEDEIPWCSAFANHCLNKSGFRYTNSAWARSFETYQGDDLEEPRKGAIIVFDWLNGSGHVGFIYSWTEDSVAVLGGNQGDQVCIKSFRWDFVSAMKWPIRV